MKIRKSFCMKLISGNENEYKRRHDELWPDLKETLKVHGVHNYFISFSKDTNQLFAYAEIENEELWASISNTSICKRWWDYMSDIMETNDDNSPVATELTELFFLD